MKQNKTILLSILAVILLMQSISRQFHQTTIMITHNEEIAQMADRTIRIEDGKVVSGGVRYAR